MKHTKAFAAILIVIAMALCLSACTQQTETDLWENALYTEDTELGEGAKTVEIEVKAGEKSITFTIHTDKATVGDALIEHGLLEGEPGSYGIYIDAINGIVADYDANQSYWAFYIDGEYAMTGADSTEIVQDTAYKMEYTVME